METKPELFAYGILTEASDIRAHVGVAGRRIYVFQTRQAVNLLARSNGKYRVVDAYQPGVTGRTAAGYPVPWKDIPDIRVLLFNSYNWSVFSLTDTTSEKGRKAVDAVICSMKLGRFPFWLTAEESANERIQRQGTDIVLWHKCRIQVKCDWFAGEGPQCTGNLFLQLSERNPLKRV